MDKNIKIFTYLKERSIYERLDVLPFIVLQSIALVFYTKEDLHYLIKVVLCSLLVIFQLIAFFSKFWSERLRARICYKVNKSINGATHVRVDIANEKFKMNNR